MVCTLHELWHIHIIISIIICPNLQDSLTLLVYRYYVSIKIFFLISIPHYPSYIMFSPWLQIHSPTLCFLLGYIQINSFPSQFFLLRVTRHHPPPLPHQVLNCVFSLAIDSFPILVLPPLGYYYSFPILHVVFPPWLYYRFIPHPIVFPPW